MGSLPFSNRIRELRTATGLTQQALGERCGVTRQTIIALEAGHYGPSLELAFRIAHALGGRVDETFHWDDPR